MSKYDKKAMYLRAFQHEGYWTIKIAVEQFDSQGTADEILTLRTNAKVAEIDEPLDQAWLVLLLAVHFLESSGSVGRVRGADWPALF